MMQLRSSEGDSKAEVEKLKEQLEEMSVWKEKVIIIVFLYQPAAFMMIFLHTILWRTVIKVASGS